MTRSLAESYHVHNAREARRQVLADGAARPARAATPADLGFADLEPDGEEVAGYLTWAATAGAVVPWRLFDRAAVLAATTHPDAGVRKRAARQLHRLDARAERARR
jgi:hypothetical protein